MRQILTGAIEKVSNQSFVFLISYYSSRAIQSWLATFPLLFSTLGLPSTFECHDLGILLLTNIHCD